MEGRKWGVKSLEKFRIITRVFCGDWLLYDPCHAPTQGDDSFVQAKPLPIPLDSGTWSVRQTKSFADVSCLAKRSSEQVFQVKQRNGRTELSYISI